MQKHVTVVGAGHLALGVLGILIACIVFAAVAGGGVLSGDADARAITAIVGTGVGGLFGVLSLPWLIAGVGLVRFKPWARPLALIVALFDLLLVPMGTVGNLQHMGSDAG